MDEYHAIYQKIIHIDFCHNMKILRNLTIKMVPAQASTKSICYSLMLTILQHFNNQKSLENKLYQ